MAPSRLVTVAATSALLLGVAFMIYLIRRRRRMGKGEDTIAGIFVLHVLCIEQKNFLRSPNVTNVKVSNFLFSHSILHPSQKTQTECEIYSWHSNGKCGLLALHYIAVLIVGLRHIFFFWIWKGHRLYCLFDIIWKDIFVWRFILNVDSPYLIRNHLSFLFLCFVLKCVL